MINPIVLAGDALLEKEKRSEDVAKEAAAELREEIDSGAAVDLHLADQLIPFMGLLPGSRIKVREASSHAQTNMDVVEKFLDVKFEREDGIVMVKKK